MLGGVQRTVAGHVMVVPTYAGYCSKLFVFILLLWVSYCCCGQVHDELLLEVEQAVLPRAVQVIKECMEGVWQLRVPLRVKAKAGPQLGPA